MLFTLVVLYIHLFIYLEDGTVVIAVTVQRGARQWTHGCIPGSEIVGCMSTHTHTQRAPGDISLKLKRPKS